MTSCDHAFEHTDHQRADITLYVGLLETLRAAIQTTCHVSIPVETMPVDICHQNASPKMLMIPRARHRSNFCERGIKMLGRVEDHKTRRGNFLGCDTTHRASAHIRVPELEKLTNSLHIPQLAEQRQQRRETLVFHQFCTAARDQTLENSKQVALLHMSSLQIGSANWATFVNNTTFAMPCTDCMPMFPLNVKWPFTTCLLQQKGQDCLQPLSQTFGATAIALPYHRPGRPQFVLPRLVYLFTRNDPYQHQRNQGSNWQNTQHLVAASRKKNLRMNDIHVSQT